MKLSAPPAAYSPQDEARVRATIEREDSLNHKKGRDLEMTVGTKLILQSPNGTRYYLTVSNAGILSTTAA